MLDIGTGPGTQALALARAGFVATGSDISKSAIAAALKATEVERANGLPLTYLVDDLLDTKLAAGSFDVVVDRGVFHSMTPQTRDTYVKNVANMLKPEIGLLILGAFSTVQPENMGPDTMGPHRFTKEDIVAALGSHFDVLSQKDAYYYGSVEPRPKIIFSVFRRRTLPFTP